MPEFDKILCPVDFDASSLLALRSAWSLAEASGSTLHVLHVVSIPAGPEVAFPFTKMETAAKAKLERVVRREVVPAHYQIHVCSGDPSVEILSKAKTIGANLIVMGTHGRKRFRHLLFGSVAEHIVREAPCSVLIVRARSGRRRSPRSQARKKF